MGFAEDLAGERTDVPNCRVATARTQVAEGDGGEVDLELFDRTLADTQGIPTGMLLRVIKVNKDIQIQIGRRSLNAHRNQTCPCYMGES